MRLRRVLARTKRLVFRDALERRHEQTAQALSQIFASFINHDGQIMNAFFRIASGLALAEIVSEQTQHKEPSAIRHNFNSIMDGSLSRKK